MSRYSSSGSKSHHVRQDGGDDDWVVSWTVDFYYSGSRLRYPRVFRRYTDLAGARRFAKKWKLEEPVPFNLERELRKLDGRRYATGKALRADLEQIRVRHLQHFPPDYSVADDMLPMLRRNGWLTEEPGGETGGVLVVKFP